MSRSRANYSRDAELIRKSIQKLKTTERSTSPLFEDGHFFCDSPLPSPPPPLNTSQKHAHHSSSNHHSTQHNKNRLSLPGIHTKGQYSSKIKQLLDVPQDNSFKTNKTTLSGSTITRKRTQSTTRPTKPTSSLATENTIDGEVTPPVAASRVSKQSYVSYRQRGELLWEFNLFRNKIAQKNRRSALPKQNTEKQSNLTRKRNLTSIINTCPYELESPHDRLKDDACSPLNQQCFAQNDSNSQSHIRMNDTLKISQLQSKSKSRKDQTLNFVRDRLQVPKTQQDRSISRQKDQNGSDRKKDCEKISSILAQARRKIMALNEDDQSEDQKKQYAYYEQADPNKIGNGGEVKKQGGDFTPWMRPMQGEYEISITMI